MITITRSLLPVRIESPLDSRPANGHTPNVVGDPASVDDATNVSIAANAMPVKMNEREGLAQLDALLCHALAKTRRLREQSTDPQLHV